MKAAARPGVFANCFVCGAEQRTHGILLRPNLFLSSSGNGPPETRRGISFAEKIVSLPRSYG